MEIGFIGLGNMGAPMARRLVEAGHHLTVYDTRQESIGNLTALGAVAARSPATWFLTAANPVTARMRKHSCSRRYRRSF